MGVAFGVVGAFGGGAEEVTTGASGFGFGGAESTGVVVSAGVVVLGFGGVGGGGKVESCAARLLPPAPHLP